MQIWLAAGQIRRDSCRSSGDLLQRLEADRAEIARTIQRTHTESFTLYLLLARGSVVDTEQNCGIGPQVGP